MIAIESVVGLSRVRELVRSGEARRIRIDARLSLGEIAASVGITAACISRWESLDRTPRGEAALRYLDLLERLSSQSVGALPLAGGGA